jgi:hypothetical protein
LLDDDGRAPGRAAPGWIERVIDGHQVYLGADHQHVVADDGDTAPVHELAGVIDEDVAPDADVPSEVGIERLHEPERFVHRRAGQTREQRAHRGRIAVARVHLGDDLPRFGDERGDLGILAIGVRDHVAAQFPLEDAEGGDDFARAPHAKLFLKNASSRSNGIFFTSSYRST